MVWAESSAELKRRILPSNKAEHWAWVASQTLVGCLQTVSLFFWVCSVLPSEALRTCQWEWQPSDCEMRRRLSIDELRSGFEPRLGKNNGFWLVVSLTFDNLHFFGKDDVSQIDKTVFVLGKQASASKHQLDCSQMQRFPPSFCQSVPEAGVSVVSTGCLSWKTSGFPVQKIQRLL